MDVYLIAVGCVAIGFAIRCPFGVGAAMWGMADWDNGRRERIAARAMQGLLANPNLHTGQMSIEWWAVKYADALIERLNADPVAEGLNLLPMYSRELDEGLADGK